MHTFHHEILPASFRDLFQKTAEVHCHKTRYATNQNYFIQQVSTNTDKKQFLIEELLFGQMQNNNSKINPITPLISSADHFCCCNMNVWKIYYWTHVVKFLIKVQSLHLSHHLCIRLACVSDS